MCVCVDPGLWSFECVCVCVYEKCLAVILLQRICRIPCRKEESVSVRFLTGNRKKKLCVQKSSVQLLGAPWQESNPGMIVKETLPALGADIWLMLSKRKKSSFSEMWTEWSNNRNCAAWPWPSSFCMEGDRTGLFSREGWMHPLSKSVFIVIGAPAAL